jgi:Xaa-Pro aminopeptidase
MSETTPTERLNTGSHDLPVSPALADFMTRSWAAPAPVAGGPLDVAAYAAKRRARLSARFPGERLVIPAGGLTVRSNDVDHRFRPHSAYTYLTGDTTAETGPDGVLVMEPTGTGHEATLFIRPRSTRDSGEFYRDRRYGEFWVGRRNTLAEASAALGIECAHLDRLPERRDGRILEHDDEFTGYLSEMRLIKDEWEVAQIADAVRYTEAGFGDVAAALPRAVAHRRGERWVEGVFNMTARLEGNGEGYETIAASGADACVLHWIRNDGPVRAGDLLLLDAGVETDSLYTADITRTLPVSGRFSPDQRRVYELVYRAQEAGIAAVRPGARFRDFHQAAMRVIAEGLEDWGLLSSADEAMDPSSGLYRRYTLCSSGHMLGLDVHDCAKARSSQYLDGVLEAGHVLTVEPGLYLQPDDLTLPPELRGIGVRIEDDLVVTEDGATLLSEGLPRDPDAIETWMQSLQS